MTFNTDRQVYPGSNWWVFDFHNHTPASSDYNSSERNTLTPRDWLLAYMRAEVDCVAVTDHNCGDWIERLQNELAVMSSQQPPVSGYRPIYIFPGVELTTSDGLHVLAIYGPDDGIAKIHEIKALANCKDHANNAESICSEGAVTICKKIHKRNGVAILAHAEEVNGIFFGEIDSTTGRFTAKRGTREISQILEQCNAIEVHDTTHPALQHFSQEARKYPLVDGSDAHKTARAGTRKVWLKMAQPSIDGLKLALLDPDSSLLRPSGPNAKWPPSAPQRRISALSIKQIYLRRQPLEARFSPWFNTVIGGRGSGKSTLLETLRLALAREQELEKLGDESDVFRAFKRFRQVGGARGNAGMLLESTELCATAEKQESGVTETYKFQWTPAGFIASRL